MIRIANASGFYGDRFSAVNEMLTGGKIDVLTGDYLAELTMLILGRDRIKDPSLGYAKSFLRQMKENLALALEQGVKIVTNAGGLNPASLAAALDSLGTGAKVSYVEGDDLTSRFPNHLTANAYLGAWGIVDCLRADADVVVTGRVTDASLTLAPAAAFHGWSPSDFSELAGATVAGHVLECGTQATGGNYSFFQSIPHDSPLGFPLAEVFADGSSVITKQPGTGGAVTVGTVTAQLLYEIDSPAYLGPDVVSHFDTIALSSDGPDRVRISGVRGSAPSGLLKVCLNRIGGFRNHVDFVLAGLDLDAKEAWIRAQLPGPYEWTRHGNLLRCTVKSPDPTAAGRAFSSAAIELALASYPGFHVTAPPGDATPYGVYTADYVEATTVEHTAVLHTGTRLLIPPPPTTASPASPSFAPTPALPASPALPPVMPASPAFPPAPPASRPLPPAATASSPASPPPLAPTPAAHASPALPPAASGLSRGQDPHRIPDSVGIYGVDPHTFPENVVIFAADAGGKGAEGAGAGSGSGVGVGRGATRKVALGVIAGARSGDKGGDANVGVWVETDAAYVWLAETLTVEKLRELLPEVSEVDRYLLPNLRAVNFVCRGLLGEGVSSSTRFDPQAKALGEQLRACEIDIPEVLL
jgi:hypothetical protein